MIEDRRRHKRIDKEVVVIMKYDQLDHFVQVITKNVSTGGMCLNLAYDPEIKLGKVLNLQFEVSGHNEVVELKALVKWISSTDEKRNFQVGVEFTQIDNPEMSSLKEKLKQLLVN